MKKEMRDDYLLTTTVADGNTSCSRGGDDGACGTWSDGGDNDAEELSWARVSNARYIACVDLLFLRIAIPLK